MNKEKKAEKLRNIKILQAFYVLLWIILFPILWESFKWASIHQLISAITILHIGERRTKYDKKILGMPRSAIILFLLHLIIGGGSVMLHFSLS